MAHTTKEMHSNTVIQEDEDKDGSSITNTAQITANDDEDILKNKVESFPANPKVSETQVFNQDMAEENDDEEEAETGGLL